MAAEKEQTQDHRDGFDAGVAWGKTAQDSELRRLEENYDARESFKGEPNAFGWGGVVYSLIFGDFSSREELNDFWMNSLGNEQRRIYSEDFAHGFVYGALGVLDVRDGVESDSPWLDSEEPIVVADSVSGAIVVDGKAVPFMSLATAIADLSVSNPEVERVINELIQSRRFPVNQVPDANKPLAPQSQDFKGIPGLPPSGTDQQAAERWRLAQANRLTREAKEQKNTPPKA